MRKIAGSVPVNRTAAMVTQKGIDFTPEMKPHSIITTDIRPPVWIGEHGTGVDFTGVRFGRFVVVGLSTTAKGRWVCRCDCGNYEMRRARAIKNPENVGDRCRICRKILYITTGKDTP